MKKLSSATDVMEALGGDEKVAAMTSSTLKAVWNWHGFSGTFPANTYKLMQDELKRRGYIAPPYLWNMRGFEKPAKRAA